MKRFASVVSISFLLTVVQGFTTLHHHLQQQKYKPLIHNNNQREFYLSSSSTTEDNSIHDDNMSTTPATSAGLMFGKFVINASQIFYRSPSNLSAAIVNLKPIVPGHVLVISTRVVPRLNQLTSEEYDDLFRTVRVVQNKIEKHYGAESSNVAIQDGISAGQSVFHVHVHILPRISGDFERNDDVYDELEAWDPSSSGNRKVVKRLEVADDNDRKPRTMEQMEEETELYKSLFES